MSKRFPWEKSIEQIVEFEKKNENYYTDLPELSPRKLQALFSKVMTLDVKVRIHLLSHAIDQPKLSSEQANAAAIYIQEIYCHLMTCFAALGLSDNVDSKHLLWMLKNLDDIDVKDHASYNLQKRLNVNTNSTSQT